MNKKRLLMAAAGVVLTTLVIVAGISLFGPGGPVGMPEHITIAQARDRSGQSVKVGGVAAPGSIAWNDMSQLLSFTLNSRGDSMQVTYQGRAPNDFKPGKEVVVEGSFTSSGVFRAASVTMQTAPLCKACHG